MNQTRILQLNAQEFDGKAVIYVMSRDQRAEDNHALLIAQDEAIKHEVPLYVLFNLKIIASRSREHYEFMMQGIEQVAAKLESLSIPFIMREGESSERVDEARRCVLVEMERVGWISTTRSSRVARTAGSPGGPRPPEPRGGRPGKPEPPGPPGGP